MRWSERNNEADRMLPIAASCSQRADCLTVGESAAGLDRVATSSVVVSSSHWKIILRGSRPSLGRQPDARTYILPSSERAATR